MKRIFVHEKLTFYWKSVFYYIIFLDYLSLLLGKNIFLGIRGRTLEQTFYSRSIDNIL